MAEEKKREYSPSEEVLRAKDAWEQQQSAKPGDYRSAWQAQLDAAMDRVLNREGFSYDLNGDALYRQYKDQAVRNGRLAMMDTMGQAAAMTGGYGNSYAQNVSQQAYSQQLQSLNDRIPELYRLALDAYDRQGQDLRQQYELLAGRENQDYGRYRDSLADWQQNTDRLYGQFTDSRDFDYGMFQDQTDYDQWLAEFTENMRRYDQEWAAAHPAVAPGSGRGESVYQRILREGTAMKDNGATNSAISGYLQSMVTAGNISQADARAIGSKINPGGTKTK